MLPSSRYVKGPTLVRPNLIEPPPSHGARRSLTLWLTGTGTPVVQVGRAGPSNLLRVNDDVILVDCGNAVSYRLAELQVSLHELTHIFITHHHVDHNIDLAYLILSPFCQVMKELYEPPVIVGPPGTFVYVERLLAAHGYDLLVRQADGQDPAALNIRVAEITDGAVTGGDGWQATAIKVDHDPVDQAYGYRFDAANTSVVISGDTKPNDNLVDRARGADVLIHEALFPGFGIPHYHTLATEVGKVAQRAGVDHLVLTHLIPGHLPDEQWIEAVKPDFDGRLTVGRDLLQVIDGTQQR